MIGTRRIYVEWTAESDPAHQKYIGLILRLSCGAAIPPKQRKWPKCSQSGADLRKSEQMGVNRTYKPVHMLAQVRGGPEVVELNEYLEGKVGQWVHYPNSAEAGIAAQKAANQKAACDHGAGAGA